MSDLTYEQMKVLFENLQDRLDRTAGDKLSQEELERIRDILDKTQKNIAKQSAAAAKAADPRAIINEFFKQWRAQGPQSTGGGNRQSTNQGGTRNRRTPPPRPQANDGNTFIQRQLRERAEAERAASTEITRSGRDRKKAEDSFTKALGTFTGIVDKAASKLTGLNSSLGKGALGGLFGGALGAIGGAFDDRTDAYRQMIASGEGQFTSIQQMTNAVNDAHMTVTELAAAMEKSQGARMLGGASYTALTGALTKQTTALGNLGLSFEQREEATQAYLEMVKGQGNLRNLDQQQMVNGIQSIVRSSEETANILGLTRKDVLDARKEQANDVNIANILKNRGITGDQATAVYDQAEMMKRTFGDVGEKLFKQVLSGVSPQGEAAKFASTDADAYRIIRQAAEAARNGNAQSSQQVSANLRGYGERNFGSDLNAYKGMLAQTGTNPLGEAGQASLGGSRNATNLGTGQVNEKLGDPGTVAALKVQEAMRASMAALNTAFDTLANSIMNEYGNKMLELTTDIIKLADSIAGTIKSWQALPEITSKLGLGLLGAVAGFSLLAGGMALFSGTMKAAGSIIKMVTWPFKKMFGGGGGAPVAGGAGAGAAGAGAGGAAGGTFIQRMLGRMSGAAAGSGTKSILGGLGKGLGKNALLGAAFEGLGYLTGEKSFTMKNLAKSGLRVGGGALGGLLGSVAGPLGTFAGGTAGAMGGDWLANKIFGEDDRPQSSTDPKKGQQGVSQPQGRQQNRAADATGQRSKQALSPDQISMRIMAAQEVAVTHLKAMRDNSDTLNALIREEIQLTRTYGERTVRLLEDTSKNTRVIADNAA